MIAYNGEWTGAESNRRHMDFQSIALPTELPVQIFHNLTSETKLSYPKNSRSRLFKTGSEFLFNKNPAAQQRDQLYISKLPDFS